MNFAHQSTWRFKKLISRFVSKRAATKNIPYLVNIETPADFEVPADFEISKFEGLDLCCTVLSSAGSKELIVIWQDDVHFRAHNDSLMKRLSLANIKFGGLLVEVKQPHESLWKRYSWPEKLIGLAAVLGAITTIHGNFADLFDRPDTLIAFTDTATIDVGEASPFSAQVSIINKDWHTWSKVEKVTSQMFCPNHEPISVKPNTDSLPEVPAGQSMSIRLDGDAPTNPVVGRPTECNLSVAGVAHARKIYGWIKGGIRSSNSKPVLIWPKRIAFSFTRDVQFSQETAHAVQLQVIVYPGITYTMGASGSVIAKGGFDEGLELSLGGVVDRLTAT